MSLAFHLFLPQMRMSHDTIVERARAAERAGFEGIAFMDHLVPPLAADQEMWEAMEIASWVLAHTETLRVGHLVLCDAMRHPAVLARQATSLDHASGGRFELGIGWGSVTDELETFDVGDTSAAHRAGRFAESVEIVRQLWTGEPVDFHGEHFHLVGARQRPTPLSAIPVTIGGVGARTLAVVRRHADWWNVPVHELHRLDELRPLAGDVRISIQLMIALAPSTEQLPAVQDAMQRRFGGTALADRLVVGTVDDVVARLQPYRQQGVERVYAWFADFAQLDTLERFGEVIARTRDVPGSTAATAPRTEGIR